MGAEHLGTPAVALSRSIVVLSTKRLHDGAVRAVNSEQRSTDGFHEITRGARFALIQETIHCVSGVVPKTGSSATLL